MPQGDSQFGRIPATLVNPKRPETLIPYLNELKDKLVLRVKCPLSSVLWNLPELGRLRKAAVAALAPSGQVAQMVASRMQVIRRASAGWAAPGFIGLHLRVEADWIEHCTSEHKNPAKTMVGGALRLPSCLVPACEGALAQCSWGRWGWGGGGSLRWGAGAV